MLTKAKALPVVFPLHYHRRIVTCTSVCTPRGPENGVHVPVDRAVAYERTVASCEGEKTEIPNGVPPRAPPRYAGYSLTRYYADRLRIRPRALARAMHTHTRATDTTLRDTPTLVSPARGACE